MFFLYCKFFLPILFFFSFLAVTQVINCLGCSLHTIANSVPTFNASINYLVANNLGDTPMARQKEVSQTVPGVPLASPLGQLGHLGQPGHVGPRRTEGWGVTD